MHPSSCDFKKPWIPPPAKSSKKRMKANMSFTVNSGEKNCTFNHQKSGPVTVEITRDVLETLGEVQQDLKLIMQHYQLLLSISNFLQKPLTIDGEEGLDAGAMIAQSTQDINEFLSSYKEFEMNVSSLDHCLQNDAKDLTQLLCACKLSKDLTVLKVLKAYNSVTSTYQFILELQKPQSFHSVVREHDVLKQKVEDFQSYLTSYITQIRNLEKELACSKARGASLEERVCSLQAVVSEKNADIQKMKLLLEKQSLHQGGLAENERLIEIIEEIQRKSEAEKEALTKALKVQTSRAEHAENEISTLRSRLDEQKKAHYQLATERDQWKAEMTALNNKCIELESQQFNLEMNSRPIQDTRASFNHGHGDGKHSEGNILQLEAELDEKIRELEIMHKENNNLKRTMNKLEDKCCSLVEELKEMKISYKKLESSYQVLEDKETPGKQSVITQDQATQTIDTFLQSNEKSGIQVEEVKNQGTVTEDTLLEMKSKLFVLQEKYNRELKEKEHLKNKLDAFESKPADSFKRKADPEIPIQHKTIENHHKKMRNKATETEDVLLEMNEMKENCAKNPRDQAADTKDTLQVMERNLVVLQEKCDMEVKEKERLQHRLDELENKLDCFKRKADSDVFSQVQNPWWIYSLNLPSKDLPDQTSVEKSDLARLEENVKAKDKKIKLLEKNQAELEKKYVSQVKELQSNLNRISLNYESLQKYVKLLKSSYSNVFGSA